MNDTAIAQTPAQVSAIFSQHILRSIEIPLQTTRANIDLLDIHWYQRGRRNLRAMTRGGRLVRIILPSDQILDHGSVVFEGPQTTIAVNILACRTLVIRSESARQLAQWAYLIGNAHLPAEILPQEILIPATDSTAASLGRLVIPYEIETRRIRVDCNGLPALTVLPALAIRSSVRPPDQP